MENDQYDVESDPALQYVKDVFRVDGKILAVEELGGVEIRTLIGRQDFEVINYNGNTYRVLPPTDTRFPSAYDWHPLHTAEELEVIEQRLEEERRAIQDSLTYTREGSFGPMTFIPDVFIPPKRICILDTNTLIFTMNRDELKMPIETYEQFIF